MISYGEFFAPLPTPRWGATPSLLSVTNYSIYL